MKLRLERKIFSNDCTIGELEVDGAFECYICEDIDRHLEENPDGKIKGETAIPRGVYPVTITLSARFKRDLPLLLGVPGYSGVRIHSGNTSEDTEGCLLPGRTHTDHSVGESRAAFNALLGKIQAALNDGDTVTIEVV